ncbi:DUF1283 domain-containing protein [Yersinia pseudotuberculosis]|uniref:DUF1283 domain-containing protein n=1 Tax=Yersinia pseudotuberculosis TaxID=633 RepID=UPI0005E99179|nr:DUF1283 domain-containing protein [Yersinia pseudotuberculosis]CFV34978.1 Protein of uncharacterised function (DUF1283) [Yersinia pseudotuberculosis]
MKLHTSIRLALLLSVIINTPSMAHSGRTNAEGCHNNRKTGEYHCHGGRSRQVDYVGQDATPTPVKKAKSRSEKKENGTRTAESGRSVNERKASNPLLPAVSPPPDVRAQCVNSKDLNAYWEPVTERCLDRSTGREMTH